MVVVEVGHCTGAGDEAPTVGGAAIRKEDGC